MLVPRDFGNVHQTQLGGTLRRTHFRTKEDDLRARLQFRPAGDGVSLDDADVPAKRLRHRENREWQCPRHAYTTDRRELSPAIISSRIESSERVTRQFG